MLNESAVAQHYSHGDLLGAIQSSIAKIGKTSDTVTIDDLAPVDEFHIGSRMATQHLLDQLNFTDSQHILDVGCGIGGASRYIASQSGCLVSGIDLTPEYVDTGKAICSWMGLDKQIDLYQGSALDMPFDDAAFNGAVMFHVGMNIEDKQRLFSEVFRVLQPGASFGVYDIMRINDGQLSFPSTWATDENSSSLGTPEQYKQALTAAGFSIAAENDRREFALDFFAQMMQKLKTSGGPPAIGLHILMQDTTPAKVKNMIDNIANSLIAPVEIIACKP